ncbi:MAG: GNAT family protein [Undibacterium umbellatum]|jgi:RimJ/RimL family protein N-acetyltransferase|uniref:GNAT family N-acetyltransferase n=1 Tax=Undibacterium umbellatum TaxID=2762300 RepID=UPI003BB6C477
MLILLDPHLQCQQTRVGGMEMKLERTHDMKTVKDILSHPAIFPHIHEDGLNEIVPPDSGAFHWMLISDKEGAAGVYMVHYHNQSCVEMHTCLLPRIWGAKANDSVKLLSKYLFHQLGVKKVITNVPDYNKLALRFAKVNGMKIEGVNRESYLKDGKLIDQIMLGMTRKEWICQSQDQ